MFCPERTCKLSEREDEVCVCAPNPLSEYQFKRTTRALWQISLRPVARWPVQFWRLREKSQDSKGSVLSELGCEWSELKKTQFVGLFGLDCAELKQLVAGQVTHPLKAGGRGRGNQFPLLAVSTHRNSSPAFFMVNQPLIFWVFMNIDLLCSYFSRHITQAACSILGRFSERFCSLFLTEITSWNYWTWERCRNLRH